MEIITTNIGELKIEGYSSDYIFQTINNSHDFYEIEILTKWSEYLNEANIIFDIGANLGNHTIYWCTHLSINKAYSFEPYIPTFERLKNNITNNNFQNKVDFINMGIGERKGKASIKDFDETNFGATTLQYSEDDKSDSIEITSIDCFIEENNINSVDFIKIDVESFEISVLKGLRNTIEKHYPDIWVEVGAATFIQVFDILEGYKYLPVDIEGFNILFLHPTRHENIKKCDMDVIIQKMFYNLEKANKYYKLYLTNKKWLENKNDVINKLNDDLQTKNTDLNEFNIKSKAQTIKIKELLDKIDKQNNKTKDLEIKMTKLEEELYAITSKNDEFSNKLIECYSEFDKDEALLLELRKYIKKIETQNDYLSYENAEYKRKIQIIKDTFIGKIGINVYRMINKIKAKIRKK